MEYITDVHNIDLKWVYKDFKIKTQGFSHKSDEQFLADFFKTF